MKRFLLVSGIAVDAVHGSASAQFSSSANEKQHKPTQTKGRGRRTNNAILLGNKSLSDVNEARKYLPQTGQRRTNNLDPRKNNGNVVYEDKKSGGKVYCGNIWTAANPVYRKNHNISHIVNLTKRLDPATEGLTFKEDTKCETNSVEDIQGVFDYDESLVTSGFPVKHSTALQQVLEWYKNPGANSVRDIVQPIIQFIDDALSAGGNVFIHCKNGAHRAGMMSIAYLMWKLDLTFEAAWACAKSKRQAIDPPYFPQIFLALEKYEKELSEEEHRRELQTKCDIRHTITDPTELRVFNAVNAEAERKTQSVQYFVERMKK